MQTRRSTSRKFNSNAQLSSHAVLEWLDHASPLEATLQRARQMAQLQSLIRTHIPAGLSAAIQGANLKDEQGETALHLLVGNSAVAARIRQSGPSLLTFLQGRGWKVTAIRIRLQPSALLGDTDETTHPAKKKQAVLGEKGVQSLRGLSETLPEGQLRDALARLIAHQSKK